MKSTVFPPRPLVDGEPHEYRISPAERWGWWVRVGHGLWVYPPEYRWTLAGAHKYGRREVARRDRLTVRRLARQGMVS